MNNAIDFGWIFIMHHFRRLAAHLWLTGFIFLGGAAALAADPAPREELTWSTYRNGVFGFTLTYPDSVFVPDVSGSSFVGRAFRSRDGRAALMSAAVENSEGETIEEFRRNRIATDYAGVEFDYSPSRKRWFILSGERGDVSFYERVTFGCGGRLIYVWRMSYPASHGALYEPIVEGVHRGYRIAPGPAFNCPAAQATPRQSVPPRATGRPAPKRIADYAAQAPFPRSLAQSEGSRF